MGKATIIEAQNSNTVYEEGKTSGILGKLKGIFADYKNGTRNADRLYTEELWDNRVFGSEDVMEALETKTLFGELDHPEGDRCETLAKNAAISITKLEKRPEEGVIYGEAEILDTPTGRIVKALADSGARLGISSRGMGEEIYKEGKNIIDPNTYDFITFDVVVTPANTKARVALTESKHMNLLTESLKKEIAESETENQLNQIKTVLENINMESKEDLVKTVETKINSLNNKTNTKLQEATRAVAIKLLKEKLLENNKELEEANNANTQLSEENTSLVENNDFLKESRETLKSKLKESLALNKDLQTQLTESNSKLEEANKLVEEQETKLNETLLKQRKINEMKVENIEKQYKEKIAKLEESNEFMKTQYNNILEENKKLTKNEEDFRKIILENKNSNVTLTKQVEELTEQVNKYKDTEITYKNKLEENKTAETNKIVELTKQVKTLQKQLNESNAKMVESQNRFSKLAFNPIGTVTAVAENFVNPDLTQEDIDLINAISGKN